MSGGEKITMKLLIHKKTNTVIFAEAGKDCVDFLFNLLLLPVGAAIRHQLYDEAKDEGSIGNLYKSIGKLSTVDSLLEVIGKTTINGAALAHTPRRFYTCPSLYKIEPHLPLPVSDGKGATCWHCGCLMTTSLAYISPPDYNVKTGVVKAVTYIITDDFVFEPLTTISSNKLLNDLNVKDLLYVDEREVTLDTNQGIALLKASLTSKTVLTDTFLGKKGE